MERPPHFEDARAATSTTLKHISATLLVLALTTAAAHGQQPGSHLLGDWRAPQGSIIRIAPCGPALCLTLVHIRPDAPSQLDIHNPDTRQHTRKLCGLTIGHNFHATSPDHAESGTLYDPKSGHTYHGEMTADATHLHLRGYIGLSLFGRTETWTRTTASTSCQT